MKNEPKLENSFEWQGSVYERYRGRVCKKDGRFIDRKEYNEAARNRNLYIKEF